MVKVFSPGRWIGFRLSGFAACLALMLGFVLLSPPCFAQPPAQPKSTAPAAKTKASESPGLTKPKSETAKSSETSQAEEPKAKGEKKAEGETPAEIPPDPSQSRKQAPVEVFQDPNAVEMLDLKNYKPIRNPSPPQPGDIDAVKEMAGNPGQPVDPVVILRFVNTMVAQLTDMKAIQALFDPPPGQAAGAPITRAIHEATANLLEPIIQARSTKSLRFQSEYNRVLLQKLPALLKHHLAPRIQAMIVLGQSGNPDALKVYLDEIKNEQQTVWVKLWAFRGITNAKTYSPNRLSASQDIEAARTIASQLDKNKQWPWPVQLRALEALATLRQGFTTNSPKTAEIAAVAMRILADPQARPEVRAQAGKALGLMQITQAVPDYNYPLVAFSTGQLAAQVGDQILANYSDQGKPLNATKAEYLTTILLGPIYQAFEGVPGARESGLLHGNVGGARSAVQKVLDAIKPMARASLELIRSPNGLLKARHQDLATRVAALKDFLAKNAPASKHLVPGDEGYTVGGGEQADAHVKPDSLKLVGSRGGK
jgi:hypothetical protein